MTAKIIDGKLFAEKLRKQIAVEVTSLKNQGHEIGLAVVLVGENPASKVYVSNKAKQTVECGMNSFEFTFPDSITEEDLLNKIAELNNDKKVNGILVQLPLPSHIDEKKVIEAIIPEKDVDGFHPINVGKLSCGNDSLVPCTPQGSLMLIKDVLGDNLSGKNAVVIGRSNIVGKPMAMLLLQESCTVTIVHSRTKNIEEICKNADILVAAVGKPLFVKKEWVKEGAVVIDVGINRITDSEGKNKLVGDVDFENVKHIASAITPVPGGVGPMTIACLLNNTLKAAKMRNRE